MTPGYTVRGGKFSTRGPNGLQVVEWFLLLHSSQVSLQIPPSLGVLPAGVASMGRPAAHPAGPAVRQPQASGSGASQNVQDMSLPDRLNQLTLLMQSTDIREFVARNIFSSE